MSKMTAAQRDMALSQAALGLHLMRWLGDRFELPDADLPDLGREPNPEGAAESLRRAWSLGALSIRNMIHLLEAKGGRVLSLAVDAREVDAFASAFLMPRGSVLANAPRFPSYATLVRLKRVWTTSVSALSYRLHALGVTSDWQYRGLSVEIASDSSMLTRWSPRFHKSTSVRACQLPLHAGTSRGPGKPSVGDLGCQNTVH